MTELRYRLDQLAGPWYPSTDFEGCVVGSPDTLARTAEQAPCASGDASPGVAMGRSAAPPPPGAAASSSQQQIEAIHDLACERAECYVSPAQAIAIHEAMGGR